MNSKSNSVADVPMFSDKKKILLPNKYQQEMAEITTENKEYRAANMRVPMHTGYKAANFIIRKYVNKIKYCFDILKKLSPENCKEDIYLTEKDIAVLKSKPFSGGCSAQKNFHSYLDYDKNTNKISCVLSRYEQRPFFGKSSTKYWANILCNLSDDQAHAITNGNNDDISPMRDLEESKQPLEFYKFDPNDVYGSYKHSELKDKTIDAEDTPVPDEILNSQRKVSNELDVFGVREERAESKENVEEEEWNHGNQELSSFTQPLKEEGLKEEGCAEETYTNMFFHKDDIHHIEVIRLRAYFGYYHDLQTLYNDVMELLKTTISDRCKNVLAKYYISDIIYKVQTLFKDKQRRDEFKKFYKRDFDHKYELNKLLKIEGRWEKKPGAQRKYIHVDEYVPVTDEDDTLERLNTSKTSLCNGDCCDTYERLGSIAVTEDHWVSN